MLKVFLRIVPLIENQGDAVTFLSEHSVASDQIVQNSAEGERVVLIPLVDLREQRDMKIPGDQQRQATMRRSLRLDLACPRRANRAGFSEERNVSKLVVS